jgi:MFS transporter, SP family, sugar:H+ symporter
MKVLREYRVGKFEDHEIKAEFAMISTMIENTASQGTFADIWKGTNLRRTYIVIGVNFFLQATGHIFTALYGALFVKSLGTVNPFDITATIAAVNVATSYLSMMLTDRLGRRFMIHFGSVVQIASLMTMGGLGTASNATFAIKSGIVATMVIFNFGHSFGWAPTAHTLSAELPNTRARDMTYRTASVVNVAIQCAVAISTPYLLDEPYAGLKSRVGFIFGSITVLSLIFAFFCVPDCAGRSLEDLDWLFDHRVPARKFRSAKIDLQHEAEAGKLGEVVAAEAEPVELAPEVGAPREQE